jgi:DNA-binding GntR family transcriptional regulator
MTMTMTAKERTRRGKPGGDTVSGEPGHGPADAPLAAPVDGAPGAKRHSGDQSQRSQAYESLRYALILRQVPEGARLREDEWSRRLNVNRQALREALARLHSEGLVTEGKKSGYFVPRLDVEDLKEALDVRAVAEGLAVERIIRLRLNRPDLLMRLRRACDDLEWILNKGYVLEIAGADCLFHETLVDGSGNRRLFPLHRCLPQVGLGAIGFDRAESLRVGREMLERHRLLVDAIENAQAEEACRILRQDLTCQILGQRGVSSAP